ncbi:MAG: ATP-dependent zinc metalloprotease FtsH, partial [Acidobacteria bacterium]|nr:ATP-dependent zinc metalloprotease FtsH [Acidobacteriota bacterium]
MIGAALLLYNFFQASNSRSVENVALSQLITKVRDGEVAEATFETDQVVGTFTSNATAKFRCELANPQVQAQLVEMLTAPGSKAKVMFKDGGNSYWVSVILTWVLPVLLITGLWIFMLRQMQASGNKALSFGKSRARLLSNQQKRVTFKDVAGVDEAKEELKEIIEFLKDPQKFQKLGGRIPKGVLMMGAPGTGKTLLARATAGEAGVPFFSISGSEFVEMFVGVGASRVRDLFEQGKKNAPCIIFIDEIDAVGRHRGAGLGGGHDEREQTLNQLLVEMDGFESNDGVILIASTNRPDVLDPALLRPGRFDRRIVVNRPDLRGREEILGVHTRKVTLAEDVDVTVVARGTPGFTGADLANLVNEAALNAARYNRKAVTMTDLETAKDKVLMGAERRSIVISEEEKRNTAYHESGHTMVALKCPHTDPVHKVTIIPRGRALGLTQQLPESDRYMHTRE